jgi:hypothetical protein
VWPLSSKLPLAALVGVGAACSPSVVFAPFPETSGRAALWIEPGDVVPRVTALALEPARPTLERELDGSTPDAELWILDAPLDALGLWPGVVEIGFDATRGDPPPPVSARYRANEDGLTPIEASAFPPFRLAPPRCGALEVDVVPIAPHGRVLGAARALASDRVLFHSLPDEDGIVRFLDVGPSTERGFDSPELGAPELPSGASTLTPGGALLFVGLQGGLLTWTATGGLARLAPPTPRPWGRARLVAATSSVTAAGLRVFTLDDDARVWVREPRTREWTNLALPAMEELLCDVAKVTLDGRNTLETAPDGSLWVVVRTGPLWRWDGAAWTSIPFAQPRDGLSVGCGGLVLRRPGRSPLAIVRRAFDTVVLEARSGEWAEALVDAEIDGRSAFVADGHVLVGHVREPSDGLISALVQRRYPGAQVHRCRLSDEAGMGPRAGAPLGADMVMAGFAFSSEPERMLRLRWATRPEAE